MKQLLKSGPGLVIGIPTLGRPVSLDWALAFKSLNPPINYNTVFQIVNGQEVGIARQAIAEFALEQKAKYLFFLGDDVVVPPHTLRQLIYRMDHDESITVAGGVYCSKCDPSYPLVFRGNGVGSYWDWKIGEFFEITGIGMDCTIIRIAALERLSKPWFQTVDKDSFMDGINNAENWTEDLFFCTKVLEEKAGKVYCDASIICKHFDVYGNRNYTLPLDSLPMRQRAVSKDKKCLIIGPPVDIMEKDQFEVVKMGSYDGADYRGQVDNLPFAEEEFDWVIVTAPGLETNLSEWKRVTKGKLSVMYSHLVDKEKVAEITGTTINGAYHEWSRPRVEPVEIKLELVS